MPPVTVRVDSDHIQAAARSLGISPDLPLGEQGREVIRQLAASAGGDRRRSRIAEAGDAPTRAGAEYERDVAKYARSHGFPEWERRRGQGPGRDLLDLTGMLGDGWIIGCKSLERGVDAGRRLNSAVTQNRLAIATLAERGTPTTGIIPVQILLRRSWPIGDSYAVTTYDKILELAAERRELRAKTGAKPADTPF